MYSWMINLTFLPQTSIQKKHAILANENGEIVLKPGAEGVKIRVNGITISGPRALEHKDRIIFG